MSRFDPRILGDSDPGRHIDALFGKGALAQRPLFDLILAYTASLPQTRTEPGEGHVLFSRGATFAAIRPTPEGVTLALALNEAAGGGRLRRLRALVGGLSLGMTLTGTSAFDSATKALLKRAWEAAS
ncbi:MAG: hypothetical protein HXY22_10120 [Alphaproteobacteria bacterium]|nr:hypothetical protein [Alphaproteobacteria bacterium]